MTLPNAFTFSLAAVHPTPAVGGKDSKTSKDNKAIPASAWTAQLPAPRRLTVWRRPTQPGVAGPFMRRKNPEPRARHDGKAMLAGFNQFALTPRGRAMGDLAGQRECVRCGYGWFPTRSGGERIANIHRLEIATKGKLVYVVKCNDGNAYSWSAGFILPDEATPFQVTRALDPAKLAPEEGSPNALQTQVTMDVIDHGSFTNLPSREIPVELVRASSAVLAFDEAHDRHAFRLRARIEALSKLPSRDTASDLNMLDAKRQLESIEEGRLLVQQATPATPAVDGSQALSPSSGDPGSPFTVVDMDAAPPAPRRCCACTVL